MAKQTIIELVDDLDGGKANQTVRFGLDGVEYEVDLSDKNAGKLRELLGTYVATGTRVGSQRSAGHRAPRTVNRRDEAQRIRAWANANGHNVSARGRISPDVVAAYREAVKS